MDSLALVYRADPSAIVSPFFVSRPIRASRRSAVGHSCCDSRRARLTSVFWFAQPQSVAGSSPGAGVFSQDHVVVLLALVPGTYGPFAGPLPRLAALSRSPPRSRPCCSRVDQIASRSPPPRRSPRITRSFCSQASALLRWLACFALRPHFVLKRRVRHAFRGGQCIPEAAVFPTSLQRSTRREWVIALAAAQLYLHRAS